MKVDGKLIEEYEGQSQINQVEQINEEQPEEESQQLLEFTQNLLENAITQQQNRVKLQERRDKILKEKINKAIQRLSEKL